MDRSPISRRKHNKPTSPVRPPIRVTPKKKSSSERPRPSPAGKIRTVKDNSDQDDRIRIPKRAIGGIEDDPNARHFTVANVGAGGTLYLKPSRAQFIFGPPTATPPSSSEGPGDRPGGKAGEVLGTRARRMQMPRSRVVDSGSSMPPVSLHNANQRRRPRSHSFTTLSDHARSTFFDSSEPQILLNGKEAATQRPKSSLDLSAGLLDFQIPHYQLGTPRFSEYGTAYLHNSIYASTSEGGHSSIFLGSEYDKMFPIPPGRGSVMAGFMSQNTLAPSFLHPAMAVRPRSSRQSTSSSIPAATGIATLYDQIDAKPDDISCVRYNPDTGRIAAATPARLIAQITSPQFLDYELLSDFFLTFRNFLTCNDLLEYLLARLEWAIGSTNDAGRIVRVRTFVALRHWILNYFADDFVPDYDFRQRFCDLVNDLTHQLRSRPDQGGTDMNIIGELKKCWRRTCAVVWPGTSYNDNSLQSDLYPSGEPTTLDFRIPTPNSAPPIAPPRTSPKEDQTPFEVKWSDDQAVGMQRLTHSTARASRPDTEVMTFRTASIPTSPLSEASLQVLSCSVPFLRNIGAAAKKGGEAMVRSLAAQNLTISEQPRHPSGLHQHKPSIGHRHKRSGSFSDALRDKRSPLPSAKVNSLDIQSLPVIAFTGGLVRGLLLQPSPSVVDVPVPLSPGLVPRIVRPASATENTSDRAAHHAGVKRIVGDVRRVLSGRKLEDSSPNNQKPGNESKSYHSSQPSDASKMSNSSHGSKLSQTKISHPFQPLQRIDVLGARIQDSYRSVYEQTSPSLTPRERFESMVPARRERLSDTIEEMQPYDAPAFNARWNSRLTTGSRSIVIVDDTGLTNGILPTIRSNSPPDFMYLDAEKLIHGDPLEEEYASRALPDVPDNTDEASAAWRESASKPMHDMLESQPDWNDELITDMDRSTLMLPPEANARKSSTANPVGLVDMSPIRGQLRRRPGGDLKAADHVHELESTPRPHTDDSFSTICQSKRGSETASASATGSLVPPSDTESWPLRSGRSKGRKQDSMRLLQAHFSQPHAKASFEAQALKVASLLQNSQDGGVEDALMKLEGRSPTGSMVADIGNTGDEELPVKPREPPGQGPSSTGTPSDIISEESRQQRISTPTSKDRTESTELHATSTDPDEYTRLESMTSCSDGFEAMPPILPRGTKVTKFPIHNVDADELSSLISIETDNTVIKPKLEPNSNYSKMLSTPTKTSNSYGGSFLLDDDDEDEDENNAVSFSDISTEMADQTDDDSGMGMRTFFFDDNAEIPATPPSTVSPGGHLSPDIKFAAQSPRDPLSRVLKEPASALRLVSEPLDHELMIQPPDLLRQSMTSPTPGGTAHLPFVLAFEAETIAQQLTIIEKDALDEVDWKDLIGMNWQQSPPPVHNWVDHLQNEDCNGIDIVVARFNLVVKWVVSECMLTESLNERARCFTKFIHIASQCHRMRNYASMYQVTLALLSSDLARLHKTWAVVPLAEKKILERLESLCQPLRNFANLRAEMELSTVDAGCIPFLGLFTHDLRMVAEKPAGFDPTPPANEPLINFERYQNVATIVKSLLRLIEGSSRYVFYPHPVALSRCLWLAALEDKEISALSRKLE